MRPPLRQLFSTFPTGMSGAGLLLLRTAIGLVLVSCPHHTDGVVASGGVLLLAGLLTPVAGLGMAGLLVVSQYLAFGRSLPDLSVVLLVTGCLALTLLGPGTWSLDAWLFGRREIVIPRRRF
jgi:hypothetical protein